MAYHTPFPNFSVMPFTYYDERGQGATCGVCRQTLGRINYADAWRGLWVPPGAVFEWVHLTESFSITRVAVVPRYTMTNTEAVIEGTSTIGKTVWRTIPDGACLVPWYLHAHARGGDFTSLDGLSDHEDHPVT